MIDLETLARDRASALSQPASEWIEVVKNEIITAACSFLTDGQIERVFSQSDSAPSLMKTFAAIAAAGEATWKN